MTYADREPAHHAGRKPRKKNKRSIQLKPYEATQTERGVGLECPRDDCKSRFIVDWDQSIERKKQVNVKTITCPCCSRVSLIPELHASSDET